MTTKQTQKRITKYCKAIDNAPITLNESLVTHKAWTNEAKAAIEVADEEIAKATEDLHRKIAALEDAVATLSVHKTTLMERNITQAETIREYHDTLDRLRESAGAAVRVRDQQIEALQEKNTALKEKCKRAGLIVRGLKHEINDLQTKQVNYTTHFFSGFMDRYVHPSNPTPYEFALKYKHPGYADSSAEIAQPRYTTFGEALNAKTQTRDPLMWRIVRRCVGSDTGWSEIA